MNNVNSLHSNTLSRSEQFAQWITSRVGTMYFFYMTILLAGIPLWFPTYISLIQFISSSFLQLVLLPLIMIAQNLQDRHNSIRADNDYEVNVKAEQEIQEIKAKLTKLEEFIAGR